MTITIGPERGGDEDTVSALITRAFSNAPHASGEEAAIVERLRADGDIAAAYVALDQGCIVGQVTFSPVRIDGENTGWFGLGPVAVEPSRQGEGICAALIAYGLARLGESGARGCVVLGDPSYYRRFGFEADPALTYPGVPAEYFQRLVLLGDAPRGTVTYAPAFG